ncbi:C-type lectin domain family 12 member A [Manis javanica]|nr:C-type lectin domain family 12 member A [Manis javanica]
MFFVLLKRQRAGTAGLERDPKTWQESNRICSAKNANLLKIQSESVLEFIKSQELSRYWLGLSPSKYKKDYHALDDVIVSSDWFIRNTNDLNELAVHETYRNSFQCQVLRNLTGLNLTEALKAQK